MDLNDCLASNPNARLVPVVPCPRGSFQRQPSSARAFKECCVSPKSLAVRGRLSDQNIDLSLHLDWSPLAFKRPDMESRQGNMEMYFFVHLSQARPGIS